MNSVLGRFDRWVESGPFRYADRAGYRIGYAGLMLLNLDEFDWRRSMVSRVL